MNCSRLHETLGMMPALWMPHGRYAPSPTGLLHLGSARTALVAWLSVRAAGGRFSLRIEDIDRPREAPGMAQAIVNDLSWLGLDWDDAPLRQSERHIHYEAALDQLQRRGRLFPCRYSRRDLERIATAPHGDEYVTRFPASLRPMDLASDWYASFRKNAGDAALRFMVTPGAVTFDDRVFGTTTEDVASTVGDFVVWRRDGIWAYQLAVVVDDLLTGITEVVRGADLLDSTARQILLFRALDGVVPTYTHVPLVVNEDGQKLSKRDKALSVAALREVGVDAETVVGVLGASLGLLPEVRRCKPEALIPRFDWKRIPREPWRLSRWPQHP